MATRRYSISPGQQEFSVVEAVGAAVVTGKIELTVELANSVTDGNVTGGTRPVTREEVLIGLEQIRNRILSKNWSPA